MITILGFIIIGLAAWNISSLLVQEEGPFMVFARLRHWIGIEVSDDLVMYKAYGIGTIRENIAGAFMCIWCMSRWVALVLISVYALFPGATIVVCAVLSVSTAVILIDGIARR